MELSQKDQTKHNTLLRLGTQSVKSKKNLRYLCNHSFVVFLPVWLNLHSVGKTFYFRNFLRLDRIVSIS